MLRAAVRRVTRVVVAPDDGCNVWLEADVALERQRRSVTLQNDTGHCRDARVAPAAYHSDAASSGHLREILVSALDFLLETDSAPACMGALLGVATLPSNVRASVECALVAQERVLPASVVLLPATPPPAEGSLRRIATAAQFRFALLSYVAGCKNTMSHRVGDAYLLQDMAYCGGYGRL